MRSAIAYLALFAGFQLMPGSVHSQAAKPSESVPSDPSAVSPMAERPSSGEGLFGNQPSKAAQANKPLDAIASDPVAMGWMQGDPPPADKRIHFSRGNVFKFPMARYSYSHMRELMPTQRVSRGSGKVSVLPVALRKDIDAVTFTPLGGHEPMRWDQSLGANYTDGILVLHKGRIVYERYFGVTNRETRHLVHSVTKSFTGTIAEILVAEGRLDQSKRVADYIPELARSGFGDATVRQVMDMTTGLDFVEDYADPHSDVAAFALALGLMPRPADYTGPDDVDAYLGTIKKKGEHGKRFTYRSVNTEVLGWIISRIEGKGYAQVLSERIWQPLGMEGDADILIDPAGTAIAAGGLNSTLRDLARFGEAVRLGGRFNGRQVIPAEAIASIRHGGNTSDFAKAGYATLPGWSYRSMWWITHNAHGAFSARGVSGQAIYIDPRAEMVIVRFASNPSAGNSAIDPTSLPAYQALADHLMRSSVK